MNAILGSRWRRTPETFPLEVIVIGECFEDPSAAHHPETDLVDHGCGAATGSVGGDGRRVHRRGDPDHVQHWEKGVQQRSGGLAPQSAPRDGQTFDQHVVGRHKFG